jgi:Tfp pilus assembly protein PilO
MFLLSFLVPFVPFEIVLSLEVVLWFIMGYFYWQDQKEKEERLRALEEEMRRRKREEEKQRQMR